MKMLPFEKYFYPCSRGIVSELWFWWFRKDLEIRNLEQRLESLKYERDHYKTQAKVMGDMALQHIPSSTGGLTK